MKTQFIFVADRRNKKVVLLSPTLEFVRYYSAKLTCPHRLYFHHTTRLLYVGDYDYTVVIQVYGLVAYHRRTVVRGH